MAEVFFWLSKLAWFVLEPASLLILVLIAFWWLLRRAKSDQRVALVRRLLLGLIGVWLLIGAFPVGEWVAITLEKPFPPNTALPAQIGGVIVLGGPELILQSKVWQQPQYRSAAERVHAALVLAHRYPQAKIVFTGGSASLKNQTDKGSQVNQALMQQLGLTAPRFMYESESRNTSENAIRPQALLHPQPGEHWVLVTSAWHMPRSIAVFCKQGWQMIPYPVDYLSAPGHLLRIEWDPARHLEELKNATKEWLGLLVYRLTGKATPLSDSSCQGSSK